MSERILIIGQTNFRDTEKGITVLKFDSDNCSFAFVQRYDTDVEAGQQYYDRKRKVLYICDETNGHALKNAGGGRIYAYKVDKESGVLTKQNYLDCLMTKTSYCWLSKSGNYLLYSCHAGSGVVSKVVRGDDGSFRSSIVFEDGGIGVMKLNGDGSLDKISDVVTFDPIFRPEKLCMPHCHSIKASPDGSIFYSCDKGLDKIYSFSLDEESGRLVRKAEKQMPLFTAPRYLAFHPTLDVLYENNETSNTLYAFRYEKNSGELTEICQAEQTDATECMPSDLVIDEKGEYLYSGLRKVNQIAVFKIHKDGSFTKIQNIDNTDSPRGLCIVDQYLMSANPSAGLIRVFEIQEDGTLKDSGVTYSIANPGNIGVIR